MVPITNPINLRGDRVAGAMFHRTASLVPMFGVELKAWRCVMIVEGRIENEMLGLDGDVVRFGDQVTIDQYIATCD